MLKKRRIGAIVAAAAVAIGTWFVVPSAFANDAAPCDDYIQKNHTYKANGYEFLTDSLGRPERARAEQLNKDTEARGTCQAKVGRMGGKGYDGGHLIAATLDGVDRRYNLVPQMATTNRSMFATVEGTLRKCMENDGTISDFEIHVLYPQGSRTVIPDMFHFEFTGSKGSKSIWGSVEIRNDGKTDKSVGSSMHTWASVVGCDKP